MKNQSIIFAACMLIASAAFSQLNRSNFWPVAMNFAADFSSGSPVIANTNMQLTESAASISDTTGNLLFYTNGQEIRNANKSIMPNGNGILGCMSSSQGALIVPLPQDPDLYYVFTTSCAEQGFTMGAKYSIVDMRLDNGLGDVTVKNQTIRYDVAEELAATYHDNNCDFWIVMHDVDSARYYSYLLTSTGLDTTPVISSVGPAYWNVPSGTIGRSMVRFNREGTLAVQTARENTTPQIHRFDRSTGQFSSYISFLNDFQFEDYYAACFSPNDSVLYVTARFYTTSTTYSYIVQYDISLPTAQAITSSATTLLSQAGVPKMGQMQLGPDGNIYFTRYQQPFLGAIENPNSISLANVNTTAFNIGGTLVQYATPNFVSQFTGAGPNLACPSPVNIEKAESNTSVSVYPNPSNGIFNFQFEQNPGESYSLEITDLLGRSLVKRFDIASPFQLDARNLVSGAYFYSIFKGNEVIGKGKLRMN